MASLLHGEWSKPHDIARVGGSRAPRPSANNWGITSFTMPVVPSFRSINYPTKPVAKTSPMDSVAKPHLLGNWVGWRHVAETKSPMTSPLNAGLTSFDCFSKHPQHTQWPDLKECRIHARWDRVGMVRRRLPHFPLDTSRVWGLASHYFTQC